MVNDRHYTYQKKRSLSYSEASFHLVSVVSLFSFFSHDGGGGGDGGGRSDQAIVLIPVVRRLKKGLA